jgi:rsbT antagonist protein RsbS
MEEETALSQAAMYVIRGCLIVPIQVELNDELMLQIQEDILERVNKTGIKGVIIDVSGVAVIDSSLGRAIRDTVRMASLLGAKTIVSGLRPGVVSSLIDLDFKIEDVLTAINLEEGLRLLASVTASKEEPEEAEEAEEEIEAAEEKAEEGGEDETDEDDEDREVEADEEGNDSDEKDGE